MINSKILITLFELSVLYIYIDNGFRHSSDLSRISDCAFFMFWEAD